MGWKNIILDFDGTLVDSQHLFLACANELSEVFGYEPIDQISRLREKSTPSVLTDVLGLLPEQIPLWMQKLKDRLSNNIRNAVIVKGMKEALFALRDDYRLGILTSNSEETVRHILVRDGIGQVDFIWADAYVLEKDRAIEGAVAKYALSREETVYVGDEVGDVDACRKVGIKIITVSWGFNSKKILERREPDYLVETPMQLRSILKAYDI